MTHEALLKQTKEALALAIQQKKQNQDLLSSLGPAVLDALRPALEELTKNAKLTKEELIDAVSKIVVQAPAVSVPHTTVDVKIPEIVVPEPKVTVNVDAPKIPEIKIPKIVVPKPEVTVNVPAFPKIPDLQWPKENMPIEGWVQLMGVSLQNPLPVQIRDANGKPVDFAGSVTQILGGGGGGKTDFFTIKGYSQSAFADYLNADGRLRVSVETGGSGLTDSELRASGVEVHQVSGSIWSVSVNDAFRTTVASALINSDDRLRVSLEPGGSGLTDTELRAAHLDVLQVSGAIDSVWVKGFDVSVAASMVDSLGVQYSGSNPLPITVVSGALTSSVAVGDQLHDAADDGGAPVKIGGIARQTNQSAVADGDRVSATFDDLGRQIVRTQVRDLTQSAYAQLTTGTETTLLAGVASTFLDLLWVVGANNSDAAVMVDIRSGTAGSTLLTLQIPANGTAGIAPALPIKQEVVAGTWTADMGDITGTTVSISALFSKEV